MLTYELKKQPGLPLYEALYRCIREDILSGVLAPGQRLPSQRALAAHLEVSKITVEAAYSQLTGEGFLRSREKVGYFVEKVERLPSPSPVPVREEPAGAEGVDLTGGGCPEFPFSCWSKLQREVMLDLGTELLRPLPNQGILPLRRAIAEHLASFRAMAVDPERILIGAGTDFLYNLLMQLLGREKIYGVENPGYGKIRRIYQAGGVRCVSLPMDGEGVDPGAIGPAQVLHLSPSHHFPTGLVTPMHRRKELLDWMAAQPDRYIIEDDYDSEFRFRAHPMPALWTMDRLGRVIYMNTFSKTLAPSIRISYMVLPEELMERFQQKLGFYSCTVSSFEQYTLARFLSEGYFERHINRMRKAYKTRRDTLVRLIRECPMADRLTIQEQDAGLHFLLRVGTSLPDGALVDRLARAGIRTRSLAGYYDGTPPESANRCLVIHYSGLTPEKLSDLESILRTLRLPGEVGGAECI